MMMTALQRLIEELEGDASLHEPNKLRQRIEALDRLDAFNLEVSPLVAATAAATYHCAKALQAKLEAANLEEFCGLKRLAPRSSSPRPKWCFTSRPRHGISSI